MVVFCWFIHHSFLPWDETINVVWYCTNMWQMHDKLCLKQPALVNRHGVLLLQDNAQPYMAVSTIQQINNLEYKIMPHLPYSPDISPIDYHFFQAHQPCFVQEMFCQQYINLLGSGELHHFQRDWFLQTWYKWSCHTLATMHWCCWSLFWLNRYSSFYSLLFQLSLKSAILFATTQYLLC